MHSSESFRRTKIVATIGPASSNPAILREMILQGATTLRLNFSHGDHDLHRRNIRLIRQTAMDLGIQVAILQDLQGPKIRLGKFAEGSITLRSGDPFVLTSKPILGSQERSWVTYDKLAQEVPEGATILLDDGRVEMRVEAVDPEAGELFCRTIVGGTLSDNKGVNFPGVRLSIRAVTEKDKEDLYFGPQPRGGLGGPQLCAGSLGCAGAAGAHCLSQTAFFRLSRQAGTHDCQDRETRGH
jgi:pyruvate kinase (EC 2.7.1.40)